MKILFFIESLHSGGKERRLVGLIKGLQNHPDIECELVLTRKDIHYKEIFDTGIKIYYIVRKYLKKDPRLFYLFYKICKKYKPDIIHVWGNLVAIYAIPAKVLLKIPMINNQITDAPVKVKNGFLSYRLTFPFSDLIIANSKAGLKAYNAPEKKSTVIYNGFDFERIKNISDPKEIRNKFNIITKYVVGMVASFSDKKDYATYINAANTVLKTNNDVTFLAIGSGENLKKCKNLINSKDQKRIKFLGRQSDVESIVNVFDIGILTTNLKVHGEGISNSIIEYMALGKPVIATDDGGTKELVIDGKTGFLIQAKDSKKLAEKIEFLLNNEEMAIKMGTAGEKRIETKFSFKKMISSYYNLYQNLLEK